MANEKIEIDIVLNDGSVAKAFAAIPKAAQDTAKKTQNSISSIENDFKKLGGGLSAIKGSILALGAAVGVGFAINKLSGFIGDAVSEAIAGEEALNSLANALRSAGDLSQENVDKFRAFANETQRTTKLADDQVLSLAALARNYATSSDQAIELTKAAIQLSAATGTDVNSALDQLGASLSGSSGRLGKLRVDFKNLSEEALKSGGAIDLVNQRFGGSAESQVNTYAGSISQLKNEFSDFLEGIGNLIIRSPALTAVFTEVGNIFREFSSSVSNLTKDNQDVLGPIIRQAIQFGLTFNDFVIRPIEVLGNVIGLSFKIVETQFNVAIAAIGKVGGALGFVLSQFSATKSIGDSLLTFSDSSQAVLIKSLGDTAKAASNVFSQNISNGIEGTLSRIQTAVGNASTTLSDEVKIDPLAVTSPVSAIVNQSKIDIENGILDIQKLKTELYSLADVSRDLAAQPLLAPLAEQIEALPSKLEIASISSVEELEKLKTSFQSVNQAASQSISEIGSMLKNGLVNIISTGVQSVVTSLLSGENAFKAFAGSVLSIIGDLMIQLGTSIILQGQAIEALKASLVGFFGGFAVAAGIALIAAGAALKSIAGKAGGGAAAAPGSSITAPGTPATPVSNTSDQLQDRGAQVQVNVEGNVYDPQGTGLAIANLLKEAGFDGAVIA